MMGQYCELEGTCNKDHSPGCNEQSSEMDSQSEDFSNKILSSDNNLLLQDESRDAHRALVAGRT